MDNGDWSDEAEAAEIAAQFRIKLAGLRGRLRPYEMPAAVQALQEEKQAALKALRDRRVGLRHGARIARLRARAPPPAPT